jgi:hypothetical protein
MSGPVANAILLRLIIAAVFVVPGWIFMAYVAGNDGGTPAPGTRGGQAAEFMANAALNSAAQVMGAHYEAYGTFVGADLTSVPGTRLVRADTATFCVEAGEGPYVHHLDGATTGNTWNWGAVKGACTQ